LVARPVLIARLNEGPTRPLTLVSAPAGFGKTTLLSEWVAQNKLRVAWLVLDADDNIQAFSTQTADEPFAQRSAISS